MALTHTPNLVVHVGRVRTAMSYQVVRFACIGVGSTVIHLGTFLVLRASLPAQAANLGALVIATVANTAANRHWTFGWTGSRRMVTQHVQALCVFLLAWAASAGALAALPLAVESPSTVMSTTAVGASMVGTTIVRFLAMRHWIFAGSVADTRG